MFNVAEAVVRVFRPFGGCRDPQRKRMKFVVSQLGWDGYRARFEECLDEFKKEGGARLSFDPASIRSETAPDWAPAEAPTLQAVAAMASTPVNGPGIMPNTVRLQPLPDAFVRWMRSNVNKQRQQGYYHVTGRWPLGDVTSGQMGVLADLSEAYGDGSMRLTVEQNVLFRWVKRESIEPFYQRLAAAGLAGPGRT